MAVGKPKTAEMHPGPGFRVRLEIDRPDPETIAELAKFETPPVSDLLNRLYTMEREIRSLTEPGLRIDGPAVTVKTYPGDNLMVHKALDIAQPGDIIVVDTGGGGRTAAMGDLVATKARHRKIGGFVVDGVIRDLPGILRLGDFPVYARGVTPVGPLHRGPGEINHPICAGGIVVHPGDVILGDLNGVVVVPRESAGEILERLRERAATESDYTAAVARGEFSNAWVDELLLESGVAVEDPSR
jgi:regulator of RNase E activity RraA